MITVHNEGFSCVAFFKEWWLYREHQRLVFALIWSLVSIYLTLLTNAIADNRGDKYYDSNVDGLKDLGFDIMDEIFDSQANKKNSIDIINIIHYTSLGSILLYVLLFQHTYRLTIVKRFLILWNFLQVKKNTLMCSKSGFGVVLCTVLKSVCNVFDNLFFCGLISTCHVMQIILNIICVVLFICVWYM